MKMVKGEGLTYEYTKIMETDHGTEEHKVAALKSVNIEIEKGEFIVVLGHNGSGKSTFAKHINALLQPTGGTIAFDGMDVREEGYRAILGYLHRKKDRFGIFVRRRVWFSRIPTTSWLPLW